MDNLLYGAHLVGFSLFDMLTTYLFWLSVYKMELRARHSWHVYLQVIQLGRPLVESFLFPQKILTRRC